MKRFRLFIAALCLAGAAFAALSPAYKDASLPVAQRVQDLLARMTLEEKAAQMHSLWFGRANLLDDEGIRQVGLMIAARQAGPFALDIKRISLA